MAVDHRARLAWVVLLLCLSLTVVAGLGAGEGNLADPELRETFLALRGWRLANSMLAGAALAVGGVMVQGLFRNPLASPSVLGTTAGATLGGIVVLVAWSGLLAGSLPEWLPRELLIPVGCFLGSMGALFVLLAITGRDPGMVTLLLSGFILSSLFASLGGLLVSVAQEEFELGRAVVAFTLGGVEAKGSLHVAASLPWVLVGTAMAFGWGRALDVLLSGEEEATTLGVQVALVRRWVIVWTAALTAAAVAMAGALSFVGLVVPHALRPFVGVQHRALVPAAFVGGGVFVAWADVVTRWIPTRSHVPLGVVTSLVGAPVFLFLLARASREGRAE